MRQRIKQQQTLAILLYMYQLQQYCIWWKWLFVYSYALYWWYMITRWLLGQKQISIDICFISSLWAGSHWTLSLLHNNASNVLNVTLATQSSRKSVNWTLVLPFVHTGEYFMIIFTAHKSLSRRQKATLQQPCMVYLKSWLLEDIPIGIMSVHISSVLCQSLCHVKWNTIRLTTMSAIRMSHRRKTFRNKYSEHCTSLVQFLPSVMESYGISYFLHTL